MRRLARGFEMGNNVNKWPQGLMRCWSWQTVHLLLGCLIALACVVTGGCGQSKEGDLQAVTAVTPWLELLDKEQYDESWRLTVDYFKGTITASRWNELMRGYRLPLGKTLSRSMKCVRRKTTLPGVPDANYVVIKFNTDFERKKKAVETIVAIAGQNGQLSVAGYYVE